MFTAKSIDAEIAFRFGFVQEMIDEADLDFRVQELADTIAGNAPLTIKAMKFISGQVLEPDPSRRDLDRCDALVAECFASECYIEGRTAFMEKSKPEFNGR